MQATTSERLGNQTTNQRTNEPTAPRRGGKHRDRPSPRTTVRDELLRVTGQGESANEQHAQSTSFGARDRASPRTTVRDELLRVTGQGESANEQHAQSTSFGALATQPTPSAVKGAEAHTATVGRMAARTTGDGELTRGTRHGWITTRSTQPSPSPIPRQLYAPQTSPPRYRC